MLVHSTPPSTFRLPRLYIMPRGVASKPTVKKAGGKLTARKTTGGVSIRVPLAASPEQGSQPHPSNELVTLANLPPAQPTSPDPAGWNGVDLVSCHTSHLGCHLIPIVQQWCSLCYDGGDLLVECRKCRRMNCSACVPGIAEQKAILDSVEYRCPPCHGRRRVFYVSCFLANSRNLLTLTCTQGFYKGDKPLFPEGMEISSRAVSGHGSRLNGTSLAIVEFILDTLPDQGTPAQTLFANLQACYTSNPGDLKHFRCVIKIKSNLDPHRRAVDKIVKKLNR